jgi:hypothetical protein
MKKLFVLALLILALGASTTLSADGGCSLCPTKKCCYAAATP